MEPESGTRTKLGRLNLEFLHGTGLVSNDYCLAPRLVREKKKVWILSQERGEEKDLQRVTCVTYYYPTEKDITQREKGIMGMEINFIKHALFCLG
jgi:hypothetical protein